MALSNWDTLAINERGESIQGDFTSPLGVHVEFYKNWLYVQDKTAWQEGGAFVNPTVAQISEGVIVYKDVSINARRGPQHGVYAIVTHGYGESALIMAGCGVAGYWMPPAPCGHDANELGHMSTYSEEADKWLSYCEECHQVIPEAEWIGVTSECVNFLRAMLLEEVPEWYDDEERAKDVHVKMANALSTATRFNQGDAFFAAALGVEIPVSALGEGENPVLESLL